MSFDLSLKDVFLIVGDILNLALGSLSSAKLLEFKQIIPTGAMAVYGAQMTDAGIPIGTLGNSLKCFASEMCYDVVNMGLQVFAGYGYSREYPLEKLLRDARIYSIFEGTNQVQRQVIGKTLLG